MSDESTGVRSGARRSETPRSGGRGLAVFATLVSLGAFAAVVYPMLQRQGNAPAGDSSGAYEALRVEQQRQGEELKRLADGVATFDARLQSQQTQPAAQAANPTAAIPDRTLKLVEAEYLVQAANDRVKVTGDARDALAMLLAAQALVDRVDDAALVDVRAQLARDVAALRDAAAVDVDATYQRLQALAKTLPDLPVRGKRYAATPVDETQSGTAVIWQKVMSLFEFRRQNGVQRPPLGPDDATYLRLNLGLMVQSAELALLRDDGDVYRQSLESVRRWLDDYLDTSAPAVADARAEIERLLAIKVDHSQPDIGGSLVALRAIAGPLPSAAAAPANGDGAAAATASVPSVAP
ncbi:MAG TPA: uroporphyrinogen-III C-methyltransferase [Pseudomonadales bacterium]|nr:uroporphyrinogen-III C-methyltransferase [Pseudomonadales bacterium]